MKQVIKITDFLKTGKFGSVEIGDSTEDVIKKLGKPSGTMNLREPYTGIHYSMYEFVFDESGLSSIQNDHFNPKGPSMMEFSNEKIQIDPEFLKADKIKTFCDIESHLIKLNLTYSKVENCDRMVLKMASGVFFDFYNDDWDAMDDDFNKLEDYKNSELIGIRYYPKR